MWRPRVQRGALYRPASVYMYNMYFLVVMRSRNHSRITGLAQAPTCVVCKSKDHLLGCCSLRHCPRASRCVFPHGHGTWQPSHTRPHPLALLPLGVRRAQRCDGPTRQVAPAMLRGSGAYALAMCETESTRDMIERKYLRERSV